MAGTREESNLARVSANSFSRAAGDLGEDDEQPGACGRPPARDPLP
ncbi:hypothetical protein ACVMB0_002218 [Bradyrhizobium sp. USDA 4451]